MDAIVQPLKEMIEPYNTYELLDLTFTLNWTISLLVAFFALQFLYRFVPMLKEKPIEAAYNTVAMAPVVALTYLGLVDYLAGLPELDQQQRLYAAFPAAAKICMIQIAYQTFAILAALYAGKRPLLSAEMIAHHAVTWTLGVLNLHPFVHYHIIFFGGVIELSNIPLTIMDVFKLFPRLQEGLPLVYTLMRYSFCVFFLVLRVALWLYHGYQFHTDCIAGIQAGAVHSMTTVLINQIGNIFLTFLQLFWATLVLKGLFKALGLIKSKSK